MDIDGMRRRARVAKAREKIERLEQLVSMRERFGDFGRTLAGAIGMTRLKGMLRQEREALAKLEALEKGQQ
jgi:hypothetical protein